MKARYSLLGVVRSLGSPAPWVFHVSSACALATVAGTAAGLFDAAVELGHFRDRAIGETTLAGVDASPFADTYVKMTAGFAAVFLMVFLACLAVTSALRRRLGAETVDRRLADLDTLGLLALATQAIHLIGRIPEVEPLPVFLLALITLRLVLVAVEALLPASRRERAAAVLGDRDWLFFALLLPAPLVFAGWVAFDHPMVLHPLGALAVGASGAALVLALEFWRVGRREGSSLQPPQFAASLQPLRDRITLAAAPWFLIPASLPLANEVHYTLAGSSPRKIAGLLILVLALSGVALFFLGRRFRVRSGTLLHWFHAPVVLATGYLFQVYRHTLHLGDLDYFHLGEETVPTQQLALFDKLPIVDVRLAHTFSDMFYQALYALVNGVRGVDMLLWEKWMPSIVAALLIYFVLARLASPRFAFLAVAFLPVMSLLQPYYAPVVVPFLFLAAALRRPTTLRFAAVWVSALLLLLWRVDFGLVGLLTLAAIVGAYLLSGHRERLRSVARSLAAVAAAVAIVLLGLALAGGGGALVALFQTYGYRLVTRTRPEIIDGYGAAAVVQYYLLPAIAMIYIVDYAVRRLRRLRVSPARAMLAALATFSLVISLRSLERHSLIESFNDYLFLFLLAALPFLFDRLTRRQREAGFVLAVALMTIVELPPMSHRRGDLRLFSAVPTGSIFDFRPWQGDEQRVTFDAERHRSLVDFLRRELSGNETFFDFTNSPLLYVLAEKEFPTWMIPNLAQTSEPVQARVVAELETLRAADRLPFVVFKQGNYFWDNTDDVPNEVRCYRIAEYVYAHYEPWTAIGRYEVWRARGSQRELPEDTTFPAHLSEDYSMHALERRGEGESVVFEATGDDPRLVGYLDFSHVELDPSLHWTLVVEHRLAEPGPVQVFYDLDDEGFDHSRSAWAAAGQEFLEIPLSIQRTRRLTGIRVDPPAGSRLEHIDARLVAGVYRAEPLTPERLAQNWNVGRLPHVWANLDPLRSLDRTEVVDVLVDEETELDELVVPLDEESASQAGYLHLRLRAPYLAGDEPITVTVAYGDPASSITLEMPRTPPGTLTSISPPPTGKPRIHDARRLRTPQARFALEATGEDPWVHDYFDLREVPTLNAEEELWIRLAYRSTRRGAMQFFFAFDDPGFTEEASLFAPLERTLEGGELFVPLRGGEASQRWVDIRFDPPEGSIVALDEFEVLRVPKRPQDHLVRLATQWRWHSAPVDELVLRASVPVTLESLALRRAD